MQTRETRISPFESGLGIPAVHDNLKPTFSSLSAICTNTNVAPTDLSFGHNIYYLGNPKNSLPFSHFGGFPSKNSFNLAICVCSVDDK